MSADSMPERRLDPRDDDETGWELVRPAIPVSYPKLRCAHCGTETEWRGPYSGVCQQGLAIHLWEPV